MHDLVRAMSPQIDAAVASALAGELPLETAISRLLFGRDPSDDEPAWPRAAQAVWSEALARYLALSGHRPLRRGPSLVEVWDAIEKITGGRAWWDLRTGWPALALALQLRGDRAATYQLATVQGWRFHGRGSNRQITHAPCVRCERVAPAEQISDRRCPGCAGIYFDGGTR